MRTVTEWEAKRAFKEMLREAGENYNAGRGCPPHAWVWKPDAKADRCSVLEGGDFDPAGFAGHLGRHAADAKAVAVTSFAEVVFEEDDFPGPGPVHLVHRCDAMAATMEIGPFGGDEEKREVWLYVWPRLNEDGTRRTDPYPAWIVVSGAGLFRLMRIENGVPVVRPEWIAAPETLLRDERAWVDFDLN